MFNEIINKKISFPMLLFLGGENILLNDIPPESADFQEILTNVRKNRELRLAFFSSQPPFVFERIHSVCDTYIPGVSQKIDTLLREIIKNGEKENITLVAKKTGLINDNTQCAPLFLMRRILNEEYCLEGEKVPVLYKFPEVYINIYIQVKENDLHIEIENHGTLSKDSQALINSRIETGRALAQFDLCQEFEMKKYIECHETIRNFFQDKVSDKNFDELWTAASGQRFDDYWAESPYFMCINSGKHTSFYPYFAMSYSLLRAEIKKRENPGEEHFSAGMGYIQCAFILEANRSLYGTYGKIFTPRNQGDRTMAGFKIGLPSMEIVI